MSSPYRDKRSGFFRSYFEKALDYDSYLQSGTAEQISRWKDYGKQLELTNAQKNRITSFKRTMPVLVMSGIWCGDCARQGPILRQIEQASPVFTMRYIDNRENPELQDELRINGAEKVPVVVTFSEDFYELSRFGDRHLSVYQRKAATEFGTACDVGFGTPKDELTAETEEWIFHFERLQLMLRLAPALRKKYGD